jgi:hypothetical protein
MASREGKIWRCTAKHERAHEAEVCKRVHSSARQWWEREPGYVREEIEAERSKPASAPRIADAEITDKHISPTAWTAVWRATWPGAQQANNAVRYSSRADFLADVAAHHRLLWEIGYASESEAA